MSKNKGFTLIELLVVVAIIGILTAVVLTALDKSKTRGSDRGVMANLKSAMNQAEIAYNARTTNPSTYTNICTNGIIDGGTTKGIGAMIAIAAKDVGLSSVAGNGTAGSSTTATCHDSATAWAAEVPLKENSNTMFCVDSLGKNVITAGSTLTTGTDTSCN